MDAREKDSGRWSDMWSLLLTFPELFLTRTSCRKTAHGNGYYGAWPGWAVSVSVLPLTPRSWLQAFHQGYTCRAQDQNHRWNWLSPMVTIDNLPISILPGKVPEPILTKIPTPVHTLLCLNQSLNATLLAGIFFVLRLEKLVTNAWTWLTLLGLSGGWLWCLKHPHYLCSLFLINSLLSATPHVWKFFFSLSSDCSVTRKSKKEEETHLSSRCPQSNWKMEREMIILIQYNRCHGRY